MSQFQQFMKENKVKRTNTKYTPTQSLKDENGRALEWEIKPISTKENDFIRSTCFKEITSNSRRNITKNEFDHTLYLAKMLAYSVVFPNLNDAQLQNSYNVMNAEDLLKELIDNPAEYQDFVEFVTNFNGYENSITEKIEQAKK